ncbi:UNVERIFIED_CONTAM: hypothetical protein GTU68_044404 [Idotea baltica]|nr:hypothetical protein [Idotea baltica]
MELTNSAAGLSRKVSPPKRSMVTAPNHNGNALLSASKKAISRSSSRPT